MGRNDIFKMAEANTWIDVREYIWRYKICRDNSFLFLRKIVLSGPIGGSRQIKNGNFVMPFHGKNLYSSSPQKICRKFGPPPRAVHARGESPKPGYQPFSARLWVKKLCPGNIRAELLNT